MDKYLVCNADESEPGTFKDRELMQKSPHGLIEGVLIAARGAGISRAFIYIRGEYEAQARILDAALAEATSAGYIGEDILGSGFSCSIVLHRGAGAYICGEETGLLDSLEGKRGNPRLKPPFPAIQGLYQGPTLINNVETLMTMPHILRMGGEEYAKLGVATRPAQGRLGVRSRAPARQLRDRARHPVAGDHLRPRRRAAGGRSVKLWFPGGSSSPVLTAEDLDVPYDFDSLAKAGTMLGSGAIIVVDDSTPVLDVALKLAKFYATSPAASARPAAREPTGRCACSSASRPARRRRWTSTHGLGQDHIMGNCLCVLGDAMAMPIGSMIAKFRGEFEAHMSSRQLAGAGA